MRTKASFWGGVAILASFLIAFGIMLIPLSPSYKWIRPDLVTLFTIYWVANMPTQVGVYFAFAVGLLFDLMTGMLFGSMGLTLAVIAFLANNLRLRLRIYKPVQKFALIMLLVACAQLIRLWVQLIIGHTPGSATYWLCSLTSALAWPVVVRILNFYQYTFRLR